MPRMMLPFTLLMTLCGFAGAAGAQNPEITDPAEAAKDPDFVIQGEYLSEGNVSAKNVNDQYKVGAQVIALGDGKFSVVVYKGGLPGDGWKRGDARKKLEGKLVGKEVTLSDPTPAKSKAGEPEAGSKIADGVMTIVSPEGTWTLKHIERKSSTLGAKPSEGAVVLFDGTTADNFEHGTLLPDKSLLSEATSKQGFGDCTLHVEFRLSYMPFAREQARSNSGVYLHDCYEIQVLDSFGLEGENHECGGFYQLRKPDVNMCFPPLAWQTYDVKFTAPKYKDGKKVANGKVEVRHNGVVIHPEFELAHATPGRQDEGPAPRPLYLQGHGNKVEYRNIWVKETKEKTPGEAGLKTISFRVARAKEHLGHSTAMGTNVHPQWVDGCRGTLAGTNDEFLIWWSNNEMKEIHSRFADGKTYRIKFRGEIGDAVMAYRGKCLRVTKIVSVELSDK